ncbi:DUF885 domain-containing protein [Erythrobacter litoralis]|uniref:Uncharacterized conserved secreted protein n=1 Tax=Erythrobacter litoralis (strain HTCC2594) TaxID=314225 RepID=Q2NB22_ERYLH|nr:DUF885 domain-containing protein [Erythrobacter litoralis]ABC63119.1 Uncharacterized conserved secreted protein [Erythrobacter litoralis HTCC2594]
MRHLFTALALSTAIVAPAYASPVEDYTELREEIWQWRLDNSPGLATSIGDRRGDGKLGDWSLETHFRVIDEAKAYLAQIDAIDRDALPQDLAVDLGIIRSGLADAVAASEHDHDAYVLFTNRGGWFSFVAALPYRSPFFTKADYESYVGRLEAYPKVNADGISRSREAVARGLTQACEPMQGFEDRIAGQIDEDYTKTAFWRPFAGERPSSISEADWEALKARAATAIEDGLVPAYEAFLTFYADEYAPACRTGAPGVSGTPGGADYYEYLVGSYTTTDMTADEIHRLGLSEVARIRAEMEQVAAEAGFDTREAFIEHLRTDPQYYMTDADDYVDYVGALAKEIDGWMPKLFGKLPRQPYTVLPIPAANAPGNTTAYYERGSLETGQPGIYRINTTELDQRPLWELPALGVHEAVPGHHHQIALQQELDIHPLRANGTFFTAFVEGWGLYSERLGIEMGLYDTPAKQMGRLSYEMWRATRLVVDTGLHSKGWSKQQAVDYMLDNTALTAANVDAEVNRYITRPGQALAYKIGELKIRELRQRASEALGERFDLRAFHDAVLENGAVPLDVLDSHIDRWIAAQQTG